MQHDSCSLLLHVGEISLFLASAHLGVEPCRIIMMQSDECLSTNYISQSL